VIDQPGLLLVDEFAKLLTPTRNKSKEDPTGVYKDRLFRELTYIYLMIDWRSPYSDYSEQERHKSSIKDSRLSEEEWQDLDFRAACRKYKELQESALEWRILQSARKVINEFIIYFETVDPSERDPLTGKPIWKVKDIMAEVGGLSKVLEELKTLEYQYKKQADVPKANRAGIEEGFDPRKVRPGGI
jgi:hypothetical protein